MLSMNPYLNFSGNTEEAFLFYQSIFGGEFVGGILRFKDVEDGSKLPERDKNKIMHVRLDIGKGIVLMGTDVLESAGQSLTVGNNITLSISTETKSEADALFLKLSDSGNVQMPLQDTFWGAYFGMFTDKFGIQWMINFDGK